MPGIPTWDGVVHPDVVTLFPHGRMWPQRRPWWAAPMLHREKRLAQAAKKQIVGDAIRITIIESDAAK
jgi:hypothetical protein